MKALNRAISRTVSQLARYGAEGCHPPMLFALEQHLDALLTMERKQLEQVPGKLVSFDYGGAGWIGPNKYQVGGGGGGGVAYATIAGPNGNAAGSGRTGLLHPAPPQPATDVIDMTDPRNWQVGDVVVCNDLRMTAYGKEFVLVGVDGAMLRLEDGEGYELYFVDAGDHFQWLRHGEAQS